MARIFKYVMITIVVVVIGFSVVEITTSSPRSVLKNLINKGSLNSKSLNLRLDYLAFIPVGEAKLTNLGKERFRGADLIHIRAEAKTYDFVKSIFHAKATVDSYIDPVEIHSAYFLQHSEMINKPDEDKEISYDQKKHIMTYQGHRGTEQRVIDEHAQDPLSAIYYIQNKKFNLGEEFKLSLNTNQKIYIIKGRFLSKELLEIGKKSFEIWVVSVSVGRKDKNPRHQSSFKIWFLSHNGTKLPILIKAMTDVGPIVARAQ